MDGWSTLFAAIGAAAVLAAIVGQNVEIAGVKLPSPSSRRARASLLAFGILAGIGAVAVRYLPREAPPPQIADEKPAPVASPAPQPAKAEIAADNAAVAVARGKGNIALSNSSIGGDVEVTVR